MTPPSPTNAQATPRTFAAGYLFGIPLGDLGWFGTLLIGVASGFFAFFASTFCAIFVILVCNTAFHATIDFADSYRRVGFPIGLVVLIFALTYLGALWFKRILRRS
jgi:ABC-type dipeptide/oligopeptide/nickel transport system permease subunit